jgi:hypothetical protein
MNGVSVFQALSIFTFATGMALTLAGAPASGEESLKNTPFSYREDFPDLEASCEDIRNWAAKAPDTHVRFNLAIKGKLSRVSSDGALVYLAMCEEPNPKITCVTYSRNGMSAGDVVTFAGGYRLLNPEKIMLDPCLASRN